MKIKIPDNWNEVTIGQFMELSALDKNSKDYGINSLSILIDKDPEEIRKFDVNSLTKIIHHLEWSMKYPDDDFYKESIEVDGVEYGKIENLNSFSGGEWWDMEEYLNDYDNNIHNIFAMIYRPLNDEYDASECKKRGVLFKEKAVIGDVYGSLVFFSNVERKSMITIQDYLYRKTLQKTKRKKREKKD